MACYSITLTSEFLIIRSFLSAGELRETSTPPAELQPRSNEIWAPLVIAALLRLRWGTRRHRAACSRGPRSRSLTAHTHKPQLLACQMQRLLHHRAPVKHEGGGGWCVSQHFPPQTHFLSRCPSAEEDTLSLLYLEPKITNVWIGGLCPLEFWPTHPSGLDGPYPGSATLGKEH